MSQAEQLDVLILGSGQGGKLLAWYLGSAGKKVAVVERQWVELLAAGNGGFTASQDAASNPFRLWWLRNSPVFDAGSEPIYAVQGAHQFLYCSTDTGRYRPSNTS